MRSYSQYCPLAMSLDLVGDRWTLLIVRELGVRPARYSDLRLALPGIATNLLADRLRMLTEAGVVDVVAAPPPTPATIYTLTDWGTELYGIVVRLGRWGARTLVAGQGDRVWHARYVVPVVQALYGLEDADLDGLEPVTVRIDDGSEAVRVEVSADGVTAGIAERDAVADVVLTGRPESTLGLLAGILDPDSADAIEADADATRRFRAWTDRSPVRARL